MAIINLRTCRRSTLDKVLEVYKMFKSGMERKDIRSHMDMTIVSINSYIQTCESDQYKDYVKELLEDGIPEEKEPELKVMPQSGVRSYILTSAQNDTEVPDYLWKNIQAFASFTSSKILITPMVYGNRKTHDIFDNRIKDYLTRDRVVLSEEAVFYSDCGAFSRVTQNPLASVDKLLSHPHNAIMPSYKLAVEAISQPKHKGSETPYHIYATPTLTESNYKNNKSGKIAENTMNYGAIFVQIDTDGTPYIFELEASPEHNYAFCWMEFTVQDGIVKKDHGVDAIVYGDIHAHYMDDEHIDNIVKLSTSMRTKRQVFHDVLDQYACNHHHVGNIGLNVKKSINGTNNLNQELQKTADFFRKVHRDDIQTIEVESNHDDALVRYLDDKRSMVDYDNFWLNINLQNVRMLMSFYNVNELPNHPLPDGLLNGNLSDMYERVEGYVYRCNKENTTPLLFEYIMKEWYGIPDDVLFLGVDDNFVVNNHTLNLHGDRGSNGARGSVSLQKTAMTFIVGHGHTAGRRGRVITVGISFPYGKAGYSKGYSGWSLTCAFLYKIGTSTLLTLKKGKPRAKNYNI